MDRPAFRFQHADAKDLEALPRLLERYVSGGTGAAARFNWLYRANPQGKAHAWVALDPQGRICGFTSIYPRDFAIGGYHIKGSVGFDAFVLPSFRRLGIARGLHEASRESMARREVPFRFMCGPPVAANLGALVKAGARVVGPVRWITLPLRAGGLLDMLRVRGAAVQALADKAVPVNALLAGVRLATGGAPWRQLALKTRVVERVGPAFDRLWEDLSARVPVIGRRDAKFLEWRYLKNPVCRQEIVSIERHGVLLGWAAIELADKGCHLVDYLLPLEPDEARAALAALLRHVAARRAPRISLRFNAQSPYRGIFFGNGFVPGFTRERVQLLTSRADRLVDGITMEGWHLANGDLNPEASPWSVCTTPKETDEAPEPRMPPWLPAVG